MVRPWGSAGAPRLPEDDRRDLALQEQRDRAGQQQRAELGQRDRADPEHLAGQQLERRRRVEDDLHHPRRLLLDHAHRHPLAVEDDHHEDQDRHPEAEHVLADHLGGALRRSGLGRVRRRHGEPGRGEQAGLIGRRDASARAGRSPRWRSSPGGRARRRACRVGVRVEGEHEIPVGAAVDLEDGGGNRRRRPPGGQPRGRGPS